MEALACNICKEPGWNFMCMNCVARDIKEFLPKGLKNKFQKFHKDFYSHFDSPQLILNGSVYCMNCRSTKESPVCPNCYTKEVSQWLEERDMKLVKRFQKIFMFTVPKKIPVKEEPHINHEENFGLCDECGEYTEDLCIMNCGWVCKQCMYCQ